ncbi:hypothetical protein NOCARDAX2BIS_80036 [Nocardioides sp. AX2bis]|nr:hypothetical protein NOCARDAX2BIS_80036 [Nocardioides sp. AX2bis]
MSLWRQSPEGGATIDDVLTQHSRNRLHIEMLTSKISNVATPRGHAVSIH